MSHEKRLQEAQEALSKLEEQINSALWRPKYHFTPPAGWMNDPNGLCIYQGKYHLFYQHNPYSTEWGAMHWGHAISADMVAWEHLPIALAPSEKYDEDSKGGCFSGSAIKMQNRLFLMYTGTVKQGKETIQSQCLAFSKDGIRFKKYASNPVITGFLNGVSYSDFRDPKVFKHSDCWYVVIGASLGGAETNGDGKVLLYRSKDLFHWDFCSLIFESNGNWGTMCECPDFFPLNDKWVLTFSPMYAPEFRQAVYFVGTMNFENYTFAIEKTGVIDYGFDFYASQSFLDVHGNRILIAWQNSWNWMPWFNGFGPTDHENWRGSMSIPRVVDLYQDGTLYFQPIDSLKSLRNDCFSVSNTFVMDGSNFVLQVGDGISYEILADFDLKNTTAQNFGFALRCNGQKKVLLEVDLNKRNLTLNRTYADVYSASSRVRSCPLKSAGTETLILHIFVDTLSVEVFTDDGRTTMSCNIYPFKDNEGAFFYAKNGCVKINQLKAWGLSASMRTKCKTLNGDCK